MKYPCVSCVFIRTKKHYPIYFEKRKGILCQLSLKNDSQQYHEHVIENLEHDSQQYHEHVIDNLEHDSQQYHEHVIGNLESDTVILTMFLAKN